MGEKFRVGRVIIHTVLLSVLSIVMYTVISFIAHLVLSLLQTVPIISFLTGAYYLNNTAILIFSVVASIVLVCLLHEKMGVYLPKKEDKYRTVISGIILCALGIASLCMSIVAGSFSFGDIALILMGAIWLWVSFT